MGKVRQLMLSQKTDAAFQTEMFERRMARHK